MKAIFIFAAALFLLAACSTSKNTTVTDGIQLKHASYQNWSGSLGGSENAERGTDITLTFSEWPDEYHPESVIFRNRESFPVTKEINEDNQTVVKARIVRDSEVLTEVSESVFLTDRLTFTLPGGEVSYLEIEDWERLADDYF